MKAAYSMALGGLSWGISILSPNLLSPNLFAAWS